VLPTEIAGPVEKRKWERTTGELSGNKTNMKTLHGSTHSTVGRSAVNVSRIALAFALAILIPAAALAGDAGFYVRYDGGSLPDAKVGSDLRLFIESGTSSTPGQLRFMRNNEVVVVVPANAVTEISYGQDVHRRVGAAIGLAVVSFGIGGLMALTKSKKHFVGITWDNAANGNKGGVAFQCDKGNYRGVLAGIEGVSGKKAVDSATLTVKN
jgi:hypothetical protein